MSEYENSGSAAHESEQLMEKKDQDCTDDTGGCDRYRIHRCYDLTGSWTEKIQYGPY